MEKTVNKMMKDLQFLLKHGQIGMDLTDLRYQEMLCGAVEATGKKYAFYIKEADTAMIILKLV
ncbi:hypothetical protein COM13_30010 [Bacillus pseudomycoides]|uniref:hypothetical protein n=1 Tax=Bacillus pseudomycoides TaxID=64104 RepID=UPI000BEBC3A5|nr:hypothetical protein [Bacillus pseudomycoides]PDX97079.1 hypothetical protein COO07_29610 [Bacillus pseudomycoides]PEK74065.1 hypothetical protein CN597_26950 [Bacillus pseudomycoides]PEN04715.1 hypothetical protein CN640_22490 [Bacillus pseudomycoides]PGB75934.1 hypothetical protein COM13_30010 [Bacillus pseudomycoides]PHE55797.1 hypothetical protein COF52_13385 [Bacillus pseudomycoides]